MAQLLVAEGPSSSKISARSNEAATAMEDTPFQAILHVYGIGEKPKAG